LKHFALATSAEESWLAWVRMVEQTWLVGYKLLVEPQVVLQRGLLVLPKLWLLKLLVIKLRLKRLG
jgi:hypothetical protein